MSPQESSKNKDRSSLILKYLSYDENQRTRMNFEFKKYLKYYDVYCESLRVLCDIMVNKQKKSQTEVYQENIFSLLQLFTDSRNIHIENEAKFLIKSREDDDVYIKGLERNFALFDKVWLEFVNWEIFPSLERKALMYLPDNAFPVCENASFAFSDFFMKAFSVGSTVSHLSLGGIYKLMVEYNLDYPDFYKKLYSMLDSSIFHPKYRGNFFNLLSIFLSSSHLPEYVIAAFMKKLSRLALLAPANSVPLVIVLIKNLLSVHCSLANMVHRPDTCAGLPSDPFDPSEMDLGKCQAQESSLWEMATLKKHYCPTVGHAAMFVDSPLPSYKTGLNKFLEMSLTQMMQQESVIDEKKDIPLNFDTPKGLFSTKEDKMKDFWTLE